MDVKNDNTYTGMMADDSQDDRAFTPKMVHILIAIAAIILLSIFIIISLGGGSSDRPDYTTLSGAPISIDDLKHIYSGSYDGKSVLVTVKDVVVEDGGTYMVYDLKLDFIPMSNGSRCKVDFVQGKYDFGLDENLMSKVPLGSGDIVRTTAGKIVFKNGKSDLDLIQL